MITEVRPGGREGKSRVSGIHIDSGFSGSGVSPHSWGDSSVGIVWEEETAYKERRNVVGVNCLINREVPHEAVTLAPIVLF